MCTRGWYASVLSLLMFWEKFMMPDVLAANLLLTELLFLPRILYLFRMKIVRFIIFKFLSSISHYHMCLVIVLNWRSSLPSIGNNITRYAYNRFFHLMTILRSVSNSTWVIALCYVLVQNRHQKVFIGDVLRLCRGAWHSKIWQKLYWFKVFYISIWGVLGALFGWLSPPKTPVATECIGNGSI